MNSNNRLLELLARRHNSWLRPEDFIPKDSIRGTQSEGELETNLTSHLPNSYKLVVLTPHQNLGLKPCKFYVSYYDNISEWEA